MEDDRLLGYPLHCPKCKSCFKPFGVLPYGVCPQCTYTLPAFGFCPQCKHGFHPFGVSPIGVCPQCHFTLGTHGKWWW